MKRATELCALFILIFLASSSALAKEPPRSVLGIRLGMSEESARRRLGKIASQQKEEKEREGEGEQEVWILKHDRRFNYLVIRFDNKHTLWFMTVVVQKESRMQYGDLADLKSARQQTDGRNYSFTWVVSPRGREPGYEVVARGSDPQYLTSYSIRLLR